MKDSSFESCIRQMINGDKDGLKEIYSEYVTFIYAIAMSILKNKEAAEDVTSEFFIKLWNQASHYKGGKGHKRWLATIIHNMSIDHLRKSQREVATDQVEVHIKEVYEPVENDIVAKMTFEEAMSHLGRKEEQILNMKIIGGLTFREIAGILDMPMGTVTWKYRNSIEQLRRLKQ